MEINGCFTQNFGHAHPQLKIYSGRLGQISRKIRMRYFLFLVVAVLLTGIIGAAMAGPASALVVVGFWVAHYIFLDWLHNTASLQSMSDGELDDNLMWWTGRGPFGKNLPDLYRVRRSGNKEKLKSALERVIKIYDEKIRRHEIIGIDTDNYKTSRDILIKELSVLTKLSVRKGPD